MQAIWFSGKGTKEDVKQDVASAYRAFERLSDILIKRLKVNKTTDYDKSSWPFFQADVLGYNRALTEVLKLIEKESD